MRVLHVITGLGVGGAEQQLRLLVRQLPASCEVVTLTNPGAVAEGLAADGVNVRHLGMTGNRDLSALPRLTRLIRQGRYDLVHTHLYRACLYGRAAARLAGVRAVMATEHSLGAATIEGRPLGAGVRALYLASERLGTSTVAVSATIARRLREWGVPARRIHVVPNGIDADRFRFDPVLRAQARTLLGLPQDAFVVGGVGRLVAGKRFDTLVRDLPQLPGAHLLLVGGGEQEAALRALAARLGVPGRVSFAGECAYEGASGGTGGGSTSPPSSPRWTSSPPPPPTRRSASPWWRHWRRASRSSTRPAPPSTTCPPARRRARYGPTRRASPTRCGPYAARRVGACPCPRRWRTTRWLPRRPA